MIPTRRECRYCGLRLVVAYRETGNRVLVCVRCDSVQSWPGPYGRDFAEMLARIQAAL